MGVGHSQELCYGTSKWKCADQTEPNRTEPNRTEPGCSRNRRPENNVPKCDHVGGIYVLYVNGHVSIISSHLISFHAAIKMDGTHK